MPTESKQFNNGPTLKYNPTANKWFVGLPYEYNKPGRTFQEIGRFHAMQYIEAYGIQYIGRTKKTSNWSEIR